MTPCELRLQNDLDIERQRFANQWLFPWHQMNIEGRSFKVEDFRGGHISYGGNQFEGQAQTIYWQAIERYLKEKAHASFKRWEEETRDYPTALRQESLEGIAQLTRVFVASVVRNAVDTDQRLRGRGFPPTDIPRESSSSHSSANAEIERLRTSH